MHAYCPGQEAFFNSGSFESVYCALSTDLEAEACYENSELRIMTAEQHFLKSNGTRSL